jgi:hypothetical protein
LPPRTQAVAKARARQRGLASLAVDPDILALSSRFSRLDDVVGQVGRGLDVSTSSPQRM